MRSISGYVGGRPIWVDHGPGYGGSVKIGGDLVRGGPRSDSKSQALDAAKRFREKERRQAEGTDCSLTGRCRHAPCLAIRAVEASRLYNDGTNMTLQMVGDQLGGRSHKSVRYLLNLVESIEDAA